MLFFSHFVATSVILLLAYGFGAALSPGIIFLTYLAGIFIDLDHIFIYPKKSFLAAREFLSNPKNKENGKHYLHSYLQEPWFAVAVLIACLIVFLKTKSIVVFLPGIALSIHIFMDSLMKFDNLLLWPFSKKPFKGFIPSNSLAEYVASIALTILIILLAYLYF